MIRAQPDFENLSDDEGFERTEAIKIVVTRFRCGWDAGTDYPDENLEEAIVIVSQNFKLG